MTNKERLSRIAEIRRELNSIEVQSLGLSLSGPDSRRLALCMELDRLLSVKSGGSTPFIHSNQMEFSEYDDSFAV